MEHVHLIDNAPSKGESTLAPALEEFVEAGFLTLSVEPQPHAQLVTYAWCLREHGHKYNWLAMLDVDEFLAVRDQCVSPPAIVPR